MAATTTPFSISPAPLFLLFLFSLFLSLSSLLWRKRKRSSAAELSPAVHGRLPAVPSETTGGAPGCAAVWADGENGGGGHAQGGGEGEREEKKRRKRGRKKRLESSAGLGLGYGEGGGGEEKGHVKAEKKQQQQQGTPAADCLYPFSSFSSATQRRIKQQYDDLVKSNDAKALTMAQVGQFVNCLVEARKDLQHKSSIIRRKFTITKALLYKADRPSFDRLCQQIYKLEAEQKRLEEDAIVYNRIQQLLKLSPAFKTMLEVGARMEAEASDRATKAIDSEFIDISFEDLLAKEKKDSFWQKNGKLRSCTG